MLTDSERHLLEMLLDEYAKDAVARFPCATEALARLANKLPDEREIHFDDLVTTREHDLKILATRLERVASIAEKLGLTFSYQWPPDLCCPFPAKEDVDFENYVEWYRRVSTHKISSLIESLVDTFKKGN
jgi:hypothetical protein